MKINFLSLVISLNKVKKTTVFLSALAVIGCGKVCGTEVIETTQLTNATNQELQIELCKVPYMQLTGEPGDNTDTRSGIAEFVIPKTQQGTLKIDSYPIEQRKDSNDKCPTALPASYNSQVFLTSVSIHQVKLCRDNLDPVKVKIVSLSSGCPNGTTAQSQAVINCDETVLLDP